MSQLQKLRSFQVRLKKKKAELRPVKGKQIFRLLLLFLLTSFRIPLISQVVAKINCLQPYEVNFSKSEAGLVADILVLYENHDEHTFWYKLNFSDNLKITYDISSLDEQDNFDVYFYQYDGNNFCRSFIQNGIDLISFEKHLEFKAEKGSFYYLGLYPLSPGGCGHKISFQAEESITGLEARNALSSCVTVKNEIVEEKISGNDEISISGYVTDRRTGNKINCRISFTDPLTGHEKAVFSADLNGFTAHLLEDGDYQVKVEAFGYKDEISAISAYEGEKYVFAMTASEEKNYILDNVYFYPNTYALKEESKEELESIYSFLINHPEVQIEVTGHTNSNKDIKAGRLVREKGEEWNFSGTAKELSLRRATVIRDYVVGKGVDPLFIKVSGMGGDEMIVKDPSSMKDAMKNIRVEVKVLSTH